MKRAATRLLSRAFASISRHPDISVPGRNAAPKIFDRAAKLSQRNRAALLKDECRVTDYLKDEVARRLVERILDIKRRYPVIVDVGCGAGHLAKFLDQDITEKLIMCDGSSSLLHRDSELDSQRQIEIERRVFDEEQLVSTFGQNALDIVVSNLSMHWINDLLGYLIQIRHCLKPDGVFIGAMFGGDTLYELRTSLQLAELEREGGVSPRVSPMVAIADMGGLLGRAGYSLTTVDSDDIIVEFPSMFELVRDLQLMGESNAIIQRRPSLKRDTLAAASSIYRELHGNSNGTIPATFQVVYLIGWKPAESQRKPAARGSGQVDLKKIL